MAQLEPELERARRLGRRTDAARAAQALARRGFAPETLETLFGHVWE